MSVEKEIIKQLNSQTTEQPKQPNNSTYTLIHHSPNNFFNHSSSFRNTFIHTSIFKNTSFKTTFKMQFTTIIISLAMAFATSVEAKKGLHGKGFTGDGVLGAGAQLIGGIIGSAVGRRGIHERRQTDPLDSVPQYNYDMCHESLNGATLSFTPAGPGGFQVAGVPSTCMVLATALTGSFNAGFPIPLGADSLKFSGLTDEEMRELQSYFH
ncbi:unnamed protein product [Aureobasidium vineae]|uniref:Uncharacterized protein n=1 Tax=Aureobasidium vineae TaxID=2773715 RepID=A0A9N8JV43_9PEZI|nr:unnamed protein product [Aureobasidium vineae]